MNPAGGYLPYYNAQMINQANDKFNSAGLTPGMSASQIYNDWIRNADNNPGTANYVDSTLGSINADLLFTSPAFNTTNLGEWSGDAGAEVAMKRIEWALKQGADAQIHEIND